MDHKQTDRTETPRIPSLQPILATDSPLDVINKFTGYKFEVMHGGGYVDAAIRVPDLQAGEWALDNIFILYQESEQTHPVRQFKEIVKVEQDSEGICAIIIRDIDSAPNYEVIMALKPYAVHSEISNPIRRGYIKKARDILVAEALKINDNISSAVLAGDLSCVNQLITDVTNSISVIRQWLDILGKVMVLPHREIYKENIFTDEFKIFLDALVHFFFRMCDMQALLGKHEKVCELEQEIGDALFGLQHLYKTNRGVIKALHSIPKFWELLLRSYVMKFNNSPKVDTGLLEEWIINLTHSYEKPTDYLPILLCSYGCTLYFHQQEWSLFLDNYNSMVDLMHKQKLSPAHLQLRANLCDIYRDQLPKVLDTMLTAELITPAKVIELVDDAKYLLAKIETTTRSALSRRALPGDSNFLGDALKKVKSKAKQLRAPAPRIKPPPKPPLPRSASPEAKIGLARNPLAGSTVPPMRELSPPRRTLRIPESEVEIDDQRKRKEYAKRQKKKEYKMGAASPPCDRSSQPPAPVFYGLQHPCRKIIRAIFDPVKDMPESFQIVAIEILKIGRIAGESNNIKLIKDDERRKGGMKDEVYCKIRGEIKSGGDRGALVRIWGLWQNKGTTDQHLLFRHYQEKVHSGSPQALPAAILNKRK